MALAQRELNKPKVLSYDAYLREEETPGRYEIINGVRQYMTNPAAEHQVILGNLFRIFEDFADSSETGIALMSPVDIVTIKDPLQVRQPDVLYISFERWGERDFSDSSPLQDAPELVVEILSPNETRRQIQQKVNEYAGAGVTECWLVSPEAQTVEVLTLINGKSNQIGIYTSGQTFNSEAFCDLAIDVNRVFRLPRRGAPRAGFAE